MHPVHPVHLPILTLENKMGLLSKILDGEKNESSATRESGDAGRTSSASRPSAPCSSCRCIVWWRDAYDVWHCVQCSPPAAVAQVREELRLAPGGRQGLESDAIEFRPKSRQIPGRTWWVPYGSRHEDLPGPNGETTPPEFSQSRAIDFEAPECPCGESATIDVPIHGGRSIRADCARCRRFRRFKLWYGQSR